VKTMTTPRFRSDIRQWSTPQTFGAHLRLHNNHICDWVSTIVVHHTVSPTLKQWRGRMSMEAIRRYYISLGWDSGPHLFLSSGAPRPSDDGVWQLTALNERGIHAGLCNTNSIGIEVVGWYDKEGWSPAMEKLVINTIVELYRWLPRAPIGIIGHRDCGSPKTCPGRAISMTRVRTLVYEQL
jgi:hypothetical protein